MSQTTTKFFYLLFTFFIWNGMQAQNALHFDGVNDKVDCGNSSAADLTGNKITLEAWIYSESWNTNIWEGNIINKEQNGPSNGYMLRVGEGGKINFNLGDGTSWNEHNTPTAVLNLNTWYHLAATYDGSYMRIYVNGQVVDSIPKSISFTSTNTNLTIGSHNSYNRYFHGKIEEVRIWDVARTRSEIQQYMSSSLCGDEAGLRAYYKFDQGSAGGNNSAVTTLTDELGTSNGTLQNFNLTGNTSNWIVGRTFSPPYQRKSIHATICNGGTYSFGGQNLSAAGVYYDTISVSSGCDSLIELNLQVDVLTAGIWLDTINDVLWSTDTGYSYLWIDCATNTPLAGPGPGQIGQSFTPTGTGSYAVIVSSGAGCVDTSACVSFIGLEELRRRLQLAAFPNPFGDILQLKLGTFGNLDRVEVYNMLGQLVWAHDALSEPYLRVDTKSWSSSLYRVEFITQREERIPVKVVKY